MEKSDIMKIATLAEEIMVKGNPVMNHNTAKILGGASIKEIESPFARECRAINEAAEIAQKNTLTEEHFLPMKTRSLMEGKNRNIKPITESAEAPKFAVGDKVKIADNGLQAHAKKTPASAGYSKDAMDFRAELSKIQDAGTVGTVKHVFSSGGMNVDFGGKVFGVDASMVQKAEVEESRFDKPGNSQADYARTPEKIKASVLALVKNNDINTHNSMWISTAAGASEQEVQDALRELIKEKVVEIKDDEIVLVKKSESEENIDNEGSKMESIISKLLNKAEKLSESKNPKLRKLAYFLNERIVPVAMKNEDIEEGEPETEVLQNLAAALLTLASKLSDDDEDEAEEKNDLEKMAIDVTPEPAPATDAGENPFNEAVGEINQRDANELYSKWKEKDGSEVSVWSDKKAGGDMHFAMKIAKDGKKFKTKSFSMPLNTKVGDVVKNQKFEPMQEADEGKGGKWAIQDWAGNYPSFKKGDRSGYQGSGHLSGPDMTFDSFDDAEAFLSEKLGDSYEENRGEYEIVQLDVKESKTNEAQKKS